MLDLIEKVIEEDIRPYINRHYGDIKLLDFKDGIAEIKLMGQCSGCPSASYTVEDIIEERLKEKLPEVKKVVLINGISEELMEMVRNILRGSERVV